MMIVGLQGHNVLTLKPSQTVTHPRRLALTASPVCVTPRSLPYARVEVKRSGEASVCRSHPSGVVTPSREAASASRRPPKMDSWSFSAPLTSRIRFRQACALTLGRFTRLPKI